MTRLAPLVCCPDKNRFVPSICISWRPTRLPAIRMGTVKSPFHTLDGSVNPLRTRYGCCSTLTLLKMNDAFLAASTCCFTLSSRCFWRLAAAFGSGTKGSLDTYLIGDSWTAWFCTRPLFPSKMYAPFFFRGWSSVGTLTHRPSITWSIMRPFSLAKSSKVMLF